MVQGKPAVVVVEQGQSARARRAFGEVDAVAVVYAGPPERREHAFGEVTFSKVEPGASR